MSPLQGVRAATDGQASPFEEMSGGYHFQRDPEWVPNHPRYRESVPNAGAEVMSARRANRIREFAAVLVALGADDPADAPADLLEQAAYRFGVGKKTAVGYRTELRKQREAAS